MKKLVSLFVLVFVFTLTTQAQKNKRGQIAQLTTEQQTDLALKKMTLALDLSEKQQKEIKPILEKQLSERKEAMEKRKEMRANGTKPTADERYEMQAKRLDDQIGMKKNMKRILNEEQFEKFEKMAKARKMKGKAVMKKIAERKRNDNDGK